MDKEEQTLNLFQAEYNNLKREIEQRITVQNQAFNFVAIIMGAVVTLIGTTMASSNQGFTPEARLDLITLLIAVLPIAIAPLAFMFFDNELMIFGIGSYIYKDLRVRAQARLGLEGDELFLGDARVLKNMVGGSPTAQFALSIGRWLLFVALTMGPTGYALLNVNDYNAKYEFFPAIIGIDCIISVVLLVAIIATLFEQFRWRFGWFDKR